MPSAVSHSSTLRCSQTLHHYKTWSARKGVITMDNWRSRTPAEKAKFLSQQLEDIRRARALIERFEQLTQKWLKRVQAATKDVELTVQKRKP